MADDQSLNIRITTTADTAGAKQAEQSLRGVKDAAERTAGGATKAGQATRALGSEVKELSKLGHEANSVMDGLAKGGMGGLMQAGRGLAGIIRTLGTGALGAVLLPAVVAVTAAIRVMNRISEENGKAMDRMWKEAAAGAELYKQKQAEVKAAAEKDLAALVADVKRLADAYAELGQRMSETESRNRELNAAQKDLELAQARSPEEKAAIEAKYAKIDVENQALSAGVRKQNAQEALTQAGQNIRNAEAGVTTAQQDFESAQANAAKYGTSSAPEAIAARKRALAARDALTAAKSNYSQVAEQQGAVIARAQSDIGAAEHSARVAGIRGQTLGLTTAAGVASAASPDRAAELRRTASEAQARGDFATQDQAVAELRRLSASAKKLAMAVIATGATSAEAIDSASRSLEKTQKKLKLVQQAAPGGGG